MPYLDIMVHLDRGRHSETRLDLAAGLAAGLGAGLIGLRVESHPHVPETFRAAIRPEALKMQADAIAADSRRIEDGFRAAAAARGLKVEWWLEQTETELAIERVCRRARHASLAVLGQQARDGEEELPGGDLLHAVLLGSGRPVLVVPDAATAPVPGRRVAAAWNGTRESARALADAMPLLAAAEAVLVVQVGGGDSESLSEIKRHLVRNGVNAEARAATPAGHDVGGAILAAAAEFSADLLVMGGYGHSRMREVVLGGATAHVLRHANICLLMSH
ncbi:universal stress protein [Magnetospirillum sp. SS-4]|uniref:universal stress protein n=1 Tax=Magnetospirillum sp. SS-4 TaxID=2681465 RepID=UPI0013841D23|nr:universal stress protein [Magnetospirillum sp. SS-4]CAA7627544.1 Universal stress protein UspA [Magnetospirillum sp. SS-4]